MSDKFKIGDRVCFKDKYGSFIYGNIASWDHNGQRLCIFGSDLITYVKWDNEVINLSKDTGDKKMEKQNSMSDPVNKVEKALRNNANDIKPISIKECKYLLPCGKCDKTDLMCSQYE